MRIRIHMGVFAVWMVASVLAGYWYSRHIAGNPAALPARRVLYYHEIGRAHV